MVFLGIILSGVLPMITQEVRSGTLNRDAVEAQYAAEAGAKRALANLLVTNPDWNWLNAEKNFTNENGKTYYVRLWNSTTKRFTDSAYASEVCKITPDYTSFITPSAEATSSASYCIQSTGKVNGSTKTVVAAVSIAAPSTMPAALSSMVFGNASIVMSRNAKIIGSAGTNGTITMSNDSTITGNVAYVGNQSGEGVLYGNATLILDDKRKPVSEVITVPTFSVKFDPPAPPAVVSAIDWPYGTWEVNNTASPLASGYYSKNGQLKSDASTIRIQPNTTIYVTKNDLTLYRSTWTMGNNATIYIMNGDLKLNTATTLTMPGSSTVYIGKGNSTVLYGEWGNPNTALTLGTLGKASLFYCNGNANIGYTKFNINGPTTGTEKTKVYFNGDLDLNGGAIMTIAGNVEICISGTMKLTNDVQINIADNSNVTFKVGGYSEMNSNATITTGKNNSALALLIDADAHFTNKTVINKAVVIATGNISMDSSATITGAVVSTGTTLSLTNDAKITTDPDTVTLVWNNILKEESSGSGGSSSGMPGIEKISWRSQ